MISLVELIVLAFATYRATRFTQLDSMFERTRDRFVTWLQVKALESAGRWRGRLLDKIVDGLTCSFCVSVWFAGAAIVLLAWQTGYELTWLSVADWLAVAAAAMAVYRYIDPPK
jgi:hypothetical protein